MSICQSAAAAVADVTDRCRCKSTCTRLRPRPALGKTGTMTWRSCLASLTRGRAEQYSEVPLHHSVVLPLRKHETRRDATRRLCLARRSLNARGGDASYRTEMTCVAGTGRQSRRPKLPISTKMVSVSTRPCPSLPVSLPRSLPSSPLFLPHSQVRQTRQVFTSPHHLICFPPAFIMPLTGLSSFAGWSPLLDAAGRVHDQSWPDSQSCITGDLTVVLCM